MIDLVKLLLFAGDGGDGRVSFRHEKYAPKGGPDGGDGGDGGSIVIRGTRKISTLQHLVGKANITADPGQTGGRRNKTGAKAPSITFEVPLGTQVVQVAENKTGFKRRVKFGLERLLPRDSAKRPQYFLEEEGQPIPFRDPDMCEPLWLGGIEPKNERSASDAEFSTTNQVAEAALARLFSLSAQELLQSENVERQLLFTFTEEGQELVICQGGYGARGNTSFKGSTNQTPLQAEYGSYAERRGVLFELKLLADVGLVGFPNAGKSTFLSIITNARPKVASYPFTTIEPNLGILNSQQFGAMRPGGEQSRELVIADIPGLIEGASDGKGLGFDFLKHIEHCRVMQYVLALDETVIFDENLDDVEKAETLWKQYQLLQGELKNYNAELMDRQSLVTINKSDLYSVELQDTIKTFFSSKKIEIHMFSGVTHDGVAELAALLGALVSEE